MLLFDYTSRFCKNKPVLYAIKNFGFFLAKFGTYNSFSSTDTITANANKGLKKKLQMYEE